MYVILLSSLAVYSTYSLIKVRRRAEHEYKEAELHHCKHNCAVIFTGSSITGWPGFQGKYKLAVKDIQRAFEPICYFISTANESLDIAVMIINSNIIIDAIVSALIKGVRVRLLLDYDCIRRPDLNSALRHGAKIRYCKNDRTESILHYKYAVKDYSEYEGYVLCGSTNWTVTSFTQNYENLVFTSNRSAATAFHNNFEDTWDTAKER